ncbi:MAG: alpha-galactosidase [Butyrivibrio sp.]|uniref:alpha-galactosidase n=1 Tax=Butyrivibrio sp. TaxID=28121 RepID=UPI0025FF18B9|nr:alpha-galactosidase [Butyrivibrio sp.]MCR5771669.1 alpha-galactosidase [Butyrivibrio sp.]
MIIERNGCFLLQTLHTSYLFNILASGHPEHLHYGSSVISNAQYESFLKASTFGDGSQSEEASASLKNICYSLSEKHPTAGGNMIAYSDEFPDIALEDLPLEISSFGKGDIRDPFVLITHEDGCKTSDFIFEKASVNNEIKEPSSLPGSYDEKEETPIGDSVDHAGQLIVTYKDKEYGTKLEVIYSVYPDCDVITRRAVLISGDEKIHIDRIMSNQIDFHENGLVFTSFHGRWADEMHKTSSICDGGRCVSEEMAAGESGSRSNPFVMVSKKDTTEDSGYCYGFNLIYSGNHYEALSSNGYDKSRFISGISPSTFGWVLDKKEKFETPESVMTFDMGGFNGMSSHMHDFVRKHIVRGKWRDKNRPILINSWEASYFKFTESSLLKLAKEAAGLGIELFVMDDGWFGKRNDDKSSLGDWYENKDKLPNGIKGLSKKICDLGLMFGIWVEPEMVNEDSDLYRTHPDWAVQVPGHAHSKGRNQMNLDLTRKEVQDYVIESMKKVFASGDISYVKWDMNRIFSDYYSKQLTSDRQDEFMHRYYIGLYRIMDELTKAFPDILFEGCSAGGNRFDLGILCYFPQIWGSDDTDAICRADIQRGYSYGYPQSVIGAHVSAAPNHQTLNYVPLETRFDVASFGCFGYELNLCDLSSSDKKEIKEQIEFYKKYRNTLQFGQYYRLEDGRCMAVSKDKEQAIAFILQRESRPNRDVVTFKTKGLDNDLTYHFTNKYVNIDLKTMGSLINMFTPIHIKQDGILHNIANSMVSVQNEREDVISTGALMNDTGIRLRPKFGSTGFDQDGDKTGILRTGDSRLYIITKA